MHLNPMEDLLKEKLLSSTYKVSHSVCLNWGSAVYIDNRCPGDACAAGSETTH